MSTVLVSSLKIFSFFFSSFLLISILVFSTHVTENPCLFVYDRASLNESEILVRSFLL